MHKQEEERGVRIESMEQRKISVDREKEGLWVKTEAMWG